MNLLFITWNVNPELFTIGDFGVRYYGLLFALAFIASGYFMNKMFVADGKSEKDVENLTLYIIIGTVVGARLGHCLFYDFKYYFIENPWEILNLRGGGLASHGAAIGIALAIYFFNRKYNFGYLWLLDKIAIVVAISGALIRFGNLMNSEIVGIPTTMPWGFIFVQNGENFARHPAQLYESLSSLFIFIGLYWAFFKTDIKYYQGKIAGIFFVILFSLRFLYEFLKENQEAFEDNLVLNMGQILSIIPVVIGFYLFFNAKKLLNENS